MVTLDHSKLSIDQNVTYALFALNHSFRGRKPSTTGPQLMDYEITSISHAEDQ